MMEPWVRTSEHINQVWWCIPEIPALGRWKVGRRSRITVSSLHAAKVRGQPELCETCLKQNRRNMQISQTLFRPLLLCPCASVLVLTVCACHLLLGYGFIFKFIYLFCVCICTHALVMAHMWRSTWWKFVFTFYLIGSGDQTSTLPTESI